MEREEQRGEPRAGDGEAEQERCEEAGSGGVKEDVDEMVAERGVAPEEVFEPERGVEERVVLLGCAGLGPDADEAGEGAKFGARDVAGLVVPDESGGKCGKVGEEGRGEDEGDEGAGRERVHLPLGGAFSRLRNRATSGRVDQSAPASKRA